MTGAECLNDMMKQLELAELLASVFCISDKTLKNVLYGASVKLLAIKNSEPGLWQRGIDRINMIYNNLEA